MFELYQLEHIQVEQGPLVGQKVLGLSQALKQGISVLPGIVISAQVLQAMLEQISWLDPLFADLPYSTLRLDIENFRQLQTIAQQIRHQIMTAVLPDELNQALADLIQPFADQALILRPSLSVWSSTSDALLPNPIADQQSAALFNSQIYQATLVGVEQGIKQIWADLFGAKSLYYWQRQGIALHQVHLAILIQPCLPAVTAGQFQLHENHLEIQAVKGLGLALSYQEVTPDCYTIDLGLGKTQRQAGHQTIAYRLTPDFDVITDLLEVMTQPFSWVLSDVQIEQLTQLAHQLKLAFARPLMGEWLLVSRGQACELYLTQVQPSPHSLPVSPTRAEAEAKLSSPSALPQIAQSQSGSIARRRIGLATSAGQAIAPACVLTADDQPASNFEPGSILVLQSLLPSWFPLIQRAAGIVMEQGSQTSHTAILARELRIPAVMAVAEATTIYQTGERLVIDGDRGLVYPVGEALTNRADPAPTEPQPVMPAKPWSPIGTQLMVNVSHPDSLSLLETLPIDGIGLLRSELLAITALEGRSPLDWLQQRQELELTQRLGQAILCFTEAVRPKPVFYRSLDWLNQEFKTTPSYPVVPNPMLGFRGTLCYALDSTLFNLELRALRSVQQQGGQNLRLLLPFVRTVEEFEFCRDLVAQVGLMQCPQFQLWIMAEVPSVIFLLPEFVKAGVQGISIGSNDLTQLLLGVDRDVAVLANTFDQRHPAVKAAIAQLVGQARQLGIPCSLCGQAASRYPDLVEWLVQLGIHTLSVEPEAVVTTYHAIAEAERHLLPNQG
ncbi:MAG: putative PEP-binding protein [Leptolyngbyaceae cyanobacterium]